MGPRTFSLGVWILSASAVAAVAACSDDAPSSTQASTASSSDTVCFVGCNTGGQAGTGGQGGEPASCGDGTCDPSEICGTCPADCGSCDGPSFTLTRGPYLQAGSNDTVTVRWRTEEETASVVAYGPSPGTLTKVAIVEDATTEHEVKLTGLPASTKLYYAFGTPESDLLGADDDHFVTTAPPKGTSKPTRIWVLGDPGTADSDQEAVRDAYYSFTGSRETDLWILLGDNAYDDGTDAEYQDAVFDMYPSTLKSSVLWSTLGNHDGHSADSGTQTGPYSEIFSLPRQAEAGGVPSGTEAYYSFDYGSIHFVCLDSYDSDTSPDGDMMTWLTNDLAASSSQWLVAFWHHPPYSKGSHDSDDEGQLIDMREQALPILESFGVDLILSGHSHAYERSFYLNGHYDTSNTLAQSMVLDAGDGRPRGDGAYTRASGAKEGAVYVVAGSSGQTSGGSLDHPAMYISLNELGSLVVDVDGATLDVSFIDDAAVVRDSFRILKQ